MAVKLLFSKKSALLTIFLALFFSWLLFSPSINNSSGKTVANENKPNPEMKLDQSGEFVADELIVKFKESKKEFKDLEEVGAIFTREDLDLGGAKIIKVAGDSRDKLLLKLQKDPGVDYVERNSIFKITEGGGGGGGGSCYPSDYYYCSGTQWHLYKIAASSGWSLNKGSSNIAIAVLDTGVDYNHYDLGLVQNGGKIIKGRDVYAGDYDPMDENGHGTIVAGIAGARTNNNGTGVAGVAWYPRILAIRVSGPTGLSSCALITAGINEVLVNHPFDNVRVINLSLGALRNCTSMQNAVNQALGRGVVVVAGVANSAPGQTNCFIGFPAAYSGVLSVVATDRFDNHASGCTQYNLNGTYYQGVQVSAPGAEMFSTTRGSGVGRKSVV